MPWSGPSWPGFLLPLVVGFAVRAIEAQLHRDPATVRDRPERVNAEPVCPHLSWSQLAATAGLDGDSRATARW